MHSRDIAFDANTFPYNRGAGGYEPAFKDMDRVTVADNFFSGNQVGTYLDNSPSLYEGINTFSGNVYAHNSIPLQLFKMVSIFSAQALLDVLGPAGLYATDTFAGAFIPLLAAILALWVCFRWVWHW